MPFGFAHTMAFMLLFITHKAHSHTHTATEKENHYHTQIETLSKRPAITKEREKFVSQ